MRTTEGTSEEFQVVSGVRQGCVQAVKEDREKWLNEMMKEMEEDRK